MEEQIINILIQGGAVGICAYSLYILKKIVGNHLKHLTEAMNKNTNVLERLAQLINDKIK